MRLKFLKSPTFFIAAPVILGVCLLQLFPNAVRLLGLDRLEWMTYDWRVRVTHHYDVGFANDATNLGLVEISDDTIGAVNNGSLGFKYGLYWPREVYGRALHELTMQGAKAVAFDVLFATLRHDHAPAKLPNGTTINSDDYFTSQIQESSNVILGADQGLVPARDFRESAWRVANIAVDRDRDGVLRRARAFQDYKVWHPFLEIMANNNGVDLSKTKIETNRITFFRRRAGEEIVFPLDESGRFATTNLYSHPRPGTTLQFLPYTPYRAWSMGIVLAARELGLDLDHPEIKPGQIILHGAAGVTRTIPVDDVGYFYTDWSLTVNDPRLREGAFEELLNDFNERNKGKEIPNTWKGKLVVVGSTATGSDLTDVSATPLQNATYNVANHVNIANSVISGRFIHLMPLPLDLLLIVLVGSISAWITWVVSRPITGSLLMLGFVATYVTSTVAIYGHYRLWVPIILPMACAGATTHLLLLTHRVRVEQMEKRRVKGLFSRLVSPDVVNQVLSAPTLSKGGVRTEITVYFADVRGFTELTDVTQAHAAEYIEKNQLNPEAAEAYVDAQAKESLDTISLYLGTIADIVKQRKGLLDKYIGDCVMAFWGAPLGNPRHAADAVRAAIDAQLALAELNLKRAAQNKRLEEENASREKSGLPPHSLLPVLNMGTGINTGLAIVGYMGSETHLLNYTAFGREVNLASRLEGISGHGRILIGEATYLALKRDDPQLAARCLEWPPRMVKGFRHAVKLYEVLWRIDANVPPPPEENTDVRLVKPLPSGGTVKT
ncbi:MAG TPA: CHASE2 domain-containing protein [Verrucomicrobiae bacterium]